MKIILNRDFVCGADDYQNSSEVDVELNIGTTVEEFIKIVLELNFLQYLSFHTCYVVKSLLDVALIFPEGKHVIFLVDKNVKISDFLKDGRVEFDFSLTWQQESIKSKYLQSRVMQSI
ncbi:hypothetical protein [uncultured Deefgea sp.]|uniref:hypothetical protein n=1 Tax=uncultured Deefgea sp. TaxID=1304914 RepID=UPI0025951C99|nr:hypothetical protein [uncultured Deefgea sp.]